MNAKYYVLAKTLWQGDTWGAIAGPFSDPAEADKVADDNADNGFNEYGLQNLKDVVKTVVVNTTTMRRNYGLSVAHALEQIRYADEARHDEMLWMLEDQKRHSIR